MGPQPHPNLLHFLAVRRAILFLSQPAASLQAMGSFSHRLEPPKLWAKINLFFIISCLGCFVMVTASCLTQPASLSKERNLDTDTCTEGR